jgi:Cof subfamily protein (haloacid dehalogenase superfamily)
MKKILFTDLDGTLLNDDKLVSKGNREAIERLLDAGHYFVVATGRPTKSAFKVANQLGLTMPGCYMIAYNGGVIFDCSTEEILMEKTLTMEYVRYLFQEAEKYGLYIQTYGEDDKIFATSDGKELEFYLGTNRRALDFEISREACDLLDRVPNKALLVDLDGSGIIKFWEEHREWEKGRCDSTFSCPQYLEYLPQGVSKGNAVRTLCEMLGIDIQNAYAAGDERNDISMIEAAGVGVAMKNAVEEAKAVADYVTENDNNHDGIAEVIDRLILEA